MEVSDTHAVRLRKEKHLYQSEAVVHEAEEGS